MVKPWELYGGQVQSPRGPWDLFEAPIVAPDENQAKTLREAITHGLQSSATGLAIRGELPEQQLPENAPWYHRLATGGAGIAVDLPLSIVGAFGGAVAGSAVAPGPGTLIGGGAGAMGVPMGLRDALMTAYAQKHARSWADVWQITKSGLIGTAKGGTIGAATLGAGRVAGAALPAATSAFTRGTVATGAELAALTGTASALEGRMPTAQEFMDNAILLGGLKGAIAAAGKLRTIYSETGKAPGEVAADAMRDKALYQELVGPLKPGQERPVIPTKYAELSLQQRVDAAIKDDPRLELIRARMDAQERGEMPKLGETTMPDPVKYEYVVDTQTAQELTKAMSQIFASENAKAARGVVPDKAVFDTAKSRAEKAFADATGLDPRVIGAAANAEEIAMRAYAVRGASERAAHTLREIASKPKSLMTVEDHIRVLAELERVQLFYKDLYAVGAEAGRALRILRTIKSDPSALGEAEMLIKLTEKKFGQGTMQDIAAMASVLKDPAQLRKFAETVQAASTTEKLLEGWKAAILSGPLTHAANVAGNVMKLGVEVPESVLTSAITALRRKFTGDPMHLAEFKAQAFSQLYGLRYGARDAMMIAGEALRGEGAHLEKADIYRHAIEGKAGTFIRTPFRLLQAEDVLFRTVAERGKAFETAVSRALKEGFNPDTAEYNQRVGLYVAEPTIGLLPETAANITKIIQEAGAEAVFSQRLGKHMEMAQAAMAGTPMGFVIPFVRTPVNLLSWAVQHSPFFLISPRWRAEFGAGGAARDRAIARVIVGAGLTMAAIEAAKDGVITGGGMFDPEQRRVKMAAGWQPYSIKIGDKHYSYQRIEPVAKVLGFAADMVEMHDKLGKDERAKGWAALMAMFGNATISTTYLSGLAGAFNALTDPRRYGEQWFEQYAGSLIPKLIGQSAMLIDSHKREVDGVTDAIQAQIPFLRESLLPKRDIWGEAMKNERFLYVTPVAVSEKTNEKVRTEAMRLELAISDVPRFITEAGPTDQRERRIELKPEQLDIMRQVSGQFAMEILRPMVNSDTWDSVPDFAKAAIYRKVVEVSRERGRYAALPADAAERQKMREKISAEIIRQVDQAIK